MTCQVQWWQAFGLSWHLAQLNSDSCVFCCLFPAPPVSADFQSPGALVDFDVLAESFVCEEGSSAEGMGVEVHNPMYDYIPPHLISLFVTDTGGYTPAYVYRLLAEYYSREDYSLESELIDRMKL